MEKIAKNQDFGNLGSLNSVRWEACKKDEETLFTRAYRDRTRGMASH